MSTISQRKQEHLEPFREGGVSARETTTWLECVQLEHAALPELALDDVDISVEFCGRRFKAPLFVTGMTGGTTEAGAINRALARVSERLDIPFGLGSQRAMLEHPEVAATFEVRSWAPDVFLAGNIGGHQLRKLSTERLNRMLDQVGANALCVHLNPAQELVQPEGDRDFRGVLESIGRVVRELERPVIVKETGAGLNRRVGLALREVGVKHVDVAGAGGTSWVGAELRRMGREHDLELGAFWDWGVPTAAAIAGLARSGLEIVGSGGIRTGLDVARALALGARLCGVASPVIQAFFQGGEETVERYLLGVCNGLKMATLLCGCRAVGELRGVPRHVSRPLRDWLTDQAAKR